MLFFEALVVVIRSNTGQLITYMIWNWSFLPVPVFVLDAYYRFQFWHLAESFCATITVHLVVTRRSVNIKQEKVKLL